MSTASVSSGRTTPIWKDFFGRRASVSDLSTPSLEKLRFRNTISTLRETTNGQPRGPVTIEPQYVSQSSGYSSASSSSGYSSGYPSSRYSSSNRYTPSSSASSSRYSSTSSNYTPNSTSAYTGTTFSYRQPRSTYSSNTFSSSNSYTSSRTNNSIDTSSVNTRYSTKERREAREKKKDKDKEKQKEEVKEAKKKVKDENKSKKAKKQEESEQEESESERLENEKNGDIPPPAPLEKKKKSSSFADLRKKFTNKFGSWFSEDDHSHNYHEKTIKLDRRHSVAEISDEKVKREDIPQVKSILKRHDDFCPSYRQTPSLSSNRREGPVCLKKDKKCQFKPQVDVIFYAQNEKTTKSLAKEQKALQEERETSNDVTEGFIQVNCKIHPGKPCMGPYWYRTRPGYGAGTRYTENNNLATETDAHYDSIYKGLEIDIVQDENNIVRLKLFVPISLGFVRNRTSVKAMSGGKKLIIIAYKIEIDHNGKEYLHQYLEKLHLPHPIDAYSVRATMDKDGNLKIDAPMLLNDYIRRDSIDHSNVPRTQSRKY